jgi:Flp pilus assembly protein TadD
VVSLQRAVALQPDYPQAWSHLVDALARLERMKEAFEAIAVARKTCASCGPGSAFTRSLRPFVLYHHDRAKKFFEQGRLDLAETGEHLVALVDPDFGDAYYNLGKIANARGDATMAEAMYRRAIELYGPAEKILAADARNNLAFLLGGRGDGAEAVSLVREAITVRGERPAYLDTLGRACDAVDDRPCARDAYTKLLRVADADVPPEALDHARARLQALGR